jgi:CubicO group peptidase (beta-lactamase class C family)
MRLVKRSKAHCLVGWKTGISLLAAILVCAAVSAQTTPNVVGDYTTEIGSKPANLHVRVDADGTLSATLDHLDPSAPWMFTCADLRVEGRTLSFTVPIIGASWKGTFTPDGTEVSGEWMQRGSSLFVTFTRQKFIPALKPSALDGIWLGVFQVAANTSTRLQVVFRSDASGRENCTADDLDLYTMGMECANVAFAGDSVSFDVPVAGLHWSGKLGADGKSLHGQMSVKLVDGGLTRDVVTPLNFTRQSQLAAQKQTPGPTYDAAMAPVAAQDLQSVLDADLGDALKTGELASSTGAGVSIGVYVRGVSRIFSYGTAKPDSIFEIGAITKTFTGLLLAEMSAQNKVRLDEPVRELLPTGTVTKPDGPEITLLDLATQRSGLPAMPDNISIANLDQPYAEYHPANLYAYFGKHGVANTPHAPSYFGSLGCASLGVALANRAQTPYAQLIEQEITGPLGMKDTVFALSPAQQLRFLPGHDQFHSPAKAWDSDVFAGVIGLRSTAGDMLNFLVANLHPERIGAKGDSASGTTLPTAIRNSLQPQAELPSGMEITMGWLYQKETGKFWHNGATAAYSSYAFFNPKGDYAVIVLLNGSPGVNGAFVENLGRHIGQRLAGQPAISLRP